MDDAMGLWIGTAVSCAAHVVLAVFVLGAPEAPRPRLTPSSVAIEIRDPAPPPEPPPPPEPELAKDEPAPTARAPEIAPAPDPAPTPEATPAEPDTAPVDLGGLTLTNDGPGGTWSAPRGTASARAGTRRAVPSAPAPTRPAPAPSAPLVVAARDLSRRPSPPALDGQLARNYPPDLRRRGIGGIAVVRILIGADGRVQSSSVVSESESGFGQACRRTVLGSRWAPPLDKSGRAVGTHVSYTCRFVVDGG